MTRRKPAIGAVFVTAAAALFGITVQAQSGTGTEGAAAGMAAADPAPIVVPGSLTPRAEYGRMLYDAVCAVCHGANGGGGTGKAPPLVDQAYVPGHHPDTSFVSAAADGVPAHDWNFGDMPAVKAISEREAGLITTYIRELQRANGIE